MSSQREPTPIFFSAWFAADPLDGINKKAIKNPLSHAEAAKTQRKKKGFLALQQKNFALHVLCLPR